MKIYICIFVSTHTYINTHTHTRSHTRTPTHLYYHPQHRYFTNNPRCHHVYNGTRNAGVSVGYHE